MKDKIKLRAIDMFLTLGFKTVTMDCIAINLGISKKTLYNHFDNKEELIIESTKLLSHYISDAINAIKTKNYNAIEENFEIKKMFSDLFKTSDTHSIYELKVYYPEIYYTIINREKERYLVNFRENIKKGINEDLYRKNINIELYVFFYYKLLFQIKEKSHSQKDFIREEIELFEYHIRSMATAKGINELEKQLTKLLN
ncbi:transcriptional regulator, TetR family [Flavobacterium aquidurense]|uniref:TetR family transcriptional regulator n=1 Tax=Flavobacterium frigidimaris TaxID=262320 RepID=A0ABX4BM98_FLAFR|nr:TetR/AcrR family transcriptional regulator [Flavobacterium frigidimaris]OXA77413.1 TetR family transcriptional regulator [Flavobacterium frigidimaris]SDZ62595.1 transcriptional regulator, TetR family [Flavobacterium aquidurense]